VLPVLLRALGVSRAGCLFPWRRHAFPSPCTEQVNFKFGDNGLGVEEEPAHMSGWVMHGTADAELNLAAGEFVHNVIRIARRPGRAIEFSHDKCVPGPARQAANAYGGRASATFSRIHRAAIRQS